MLDKISPNFLVCKFRGNTQFPQIFGTLILLQLFNNYNKNCGISPSASLNECYLVVNIMFKVDIRATRHHQFLQNNVERHQNDKSIIFSQSLLLYLFLDLFFYISFIFCFSFYFFQTESIKKCYFNKKCNCDYTRVLELKCGRRLKKSP